MEENKIKCHVTILHSKVDIYGNTYYSAIFTRTSDGKVAKGQISGGESNINYAMYKMFGYGAVFSNVETMPIREYNRTVKNFPYIGCTDEEINKNVVNQWNEVEK